MEGIVECTVGEGKGGFSGRYWRGVVEGIGGRSGVHRRVYTV